MREIVLDTETTGRDPAAGHRIIEIGLIELRDLIPTGRSLQFYLNPDRDSEEGALAVHGLTTAFLADKPRFPEVVDEILAFLGEDRLVIHNAAFDLAFLNAELAALGRSAIPMDRAIDTVHLARRKLPGARVSLDALCRHFGIDATHRTLHGALLDARLLAEVYLELNGGRQVGLGLETSTQAAVAAAGGRERVFRAPRPHAASADELAAHAAFVARLKDPIWNRALAQAAE